MNRALLFTLAAVAPAVLLAAAPAAAQEVEVAGRCATPDTVAVRGNQRVDEATIRGELGIAARTELNARVIQRGLKGLFGTGQFDDTALSCEVGGDPERAMLVVTVKERPILREVSVTGARRVSESAIKDKVDLLAGRPLDPAQVARAIARIDSTYQASGFYLARVTPESTFVNGAVKLLLRIDEGRRLAVSGVRVHGNSALSDEAVVAALKTRPEGFWWFRKGEFDENDYAGDLGERLPKLYAGQGYVDFQVVRDTMIVDRERGKAVIDITVVEGPQYRIGSFDVAGNKRFSSEEIARFYPFNDEGGPTLSQRVTGVVRRRPGVRRGVFDRTRWDEATTRLRTAYSNEGYIRADVRPVAEPSGDTASGGAPIVNLRWEIEEGSPAIINRIEIAGNDHTVEQCIRSQLVILPGDVFNQDRLIRSWQSIGNLNFFETPLIPPDTRPANDSGDVDIIFRVKEKRTGNINFGASMGQGTGLGGFIGVQQPNFLGLCKQVSLNWQFGGWVNDFRLSYTDPNVRQSQTSASLSAYRSLSRFVVGNAGQVQQTGGSLRVGFPVPRSPYTRVFVSYGGEAVNNRGSDDELASRLGRGFRSTIGVDAVQDTRIDLPFPTAGSTRSLSAQFNGGPLGGDASFQRYTGELRSYAPLGTIGGGKPGSNPARVVLGLSARGGAVFGNTGPFAITQEFGLGGVQFGEPLRGYPEFSVTPLGYDPSVDGSGFRAQLNSFGRAYFTTTAEVGLRVNQMFYVNGFYDAGSVWARPQGFNPNRLFRGAGFGLSTVTPLGPLGIDYAYGFDRTKYVNPEANCTPATCQTVPAPAWQLHFKLGQLF